MAKRQPRKQDGQYSRESYATLSNAIHAFRFLSTLKYENSAAYQKFYNYLENVKKWRNEQAHMSPTATDEEIINNTRAVVAMYLYSTGKSVKSLRTSED